MKSKLEQRRESLFASGKPVHRPMVRDDMRWLWVASRRAGSDLSPDKFNEAVLGVITQADLTWMLEDRNAEFQSGWGPVGLVLATFDGWSLAPHVEWFPWATVRNKLRCTVGYLQAMRGVKDIGSIKIFSDEIYQDWFRRLRQYILIHPVGMIPAGRISGDEFIFHIRGRKHYESQRSRNNSRRDRRRPARAGNGRATKRQPEHVVPAIVTGTDSATASSDSKHIDGSKLH